MAKRKVEVEVVEIDESGEVIETGTTKVVKVEAKDKPCAREGCDNPRWTLKTGFTISTCRECEKKRQVVKNRRLKVRRTKLEDLEFTPSVRKTFEQHGMKTIGDVLKVAGDPPAGLGPKTLAKVEDFYNQKVENDS